MKSLKTILLVAVAVLITVGLFSFKSEEPVKEYATLTIGMSKASIYYGNNKTEDIKTANMSNYNGLTDILSNMSKQGWVVKTNSMGLQTFVYTLERTKQ